MNSDVFKAYRDQLAKEELENESLRQQLAAALDGLEVAKNVANGNVEAKFDAWKQLDAMEHELAAALAAIKVKDAFIERVAKQTPEKPDYWTPCGQCEHNSSEAEDVLAATTDLDGLIVCHAEPVAEVKKHTGSLKDMAIIVWSGKQPAEGTQLYRAWEPTSGAS